jgi:hypothetical protein
VVSHLTGMMENGGNGEKIPLDDELSVKSISSVNIFQEFFFESFRISINLKTEKPMLGEDFS